MGTIRPRRMGMQLPLDLLEAPAPLEQVFDGLPTEERTVLVVALARLIAQAAVPQELDLDE
jgi:hypothetical protein